MTFVHVAAVEQALRNRPVVEAPVHSMGELLKLNGGLTGSQLLSNGEPVFISPAATVHIESAYRNPRRNVEVGSKYPVTSKHVWGRAIDIVPTSGTQGVTPSGRTVPLRLHEHVYPTLLQAARSVSPASIGEDGAVQVIIGSPSEDHVHMQW